MKEIFLQYIWQNGLFDKQNLITTSGESVSILKLGERNIDAGPDFFNARIKINDTLWAGNIEIHIKASDWYKHKHETDSSYDSVILHVVRDCDTAVKRSSGDIIPTIELKYDNELEQEFEKLISYPGTIRCADKIGDIDSFTFNFWLDKLTIERLEIKTSRVLEQLEVYNNNWEECFYISIAKNFGFKVNEAPFELLARSLPLNIIGKHKNNKTQIEALLFGQAGMLSHIKEHDTYSMELYAEYLFLQNKYNLLPIATELWKNLRLRPSNFPTIRIAQFADLIYKSNKLFSKIISLPTISELNDLLDCNVSEYWNTHYIFNKETKNKPKHFGESSRNLIILNTIIPFIFAYGIKKDDQALKQKAIDMLEKLPPESNSVIENWTQLEIKPQNALSSQALLQLTNYYCKNGNCLRCEIGNKIIRNKISVSVK